MKHGLLSIFLVLSCFFHISAHARGEWESSGAPIRPYIPTGEANYHCDLENSLQSGSKYVSDTKPVEFKTADFQANGSASRDVGTTTVYLHFFKGIGGDRVSMTLDLKSPSGQQKASATFDVARAEGAIGGLVELVLGEKIYAANVKCTAN